MSLLDDAQHLYDEYMDDSNDDPCDVAMHYTELHPRIRAALDLLSEFADPKNWVGGGQYDGPRSLLEARRILGLDPEDDDE